MKENGPTVTMHGTCEANRLKTSGEISDRECHPEFEGVDRLKTSGEKVGPVEGEKYLTIQHNLVVELVNLYPNLCIGVISTYAIYCHYNFIQILYVFYTILYHLNYVRSGRRYKMSIK